MSEQLNEQTYGQTYGPRERQPARHPVVIGHLTMGVAFLGLLAVWALIAGDVVDGADIRILLPVPWVLAGVAGLVALVTSDRRRVR